MGGCDCYLLVWDLGIAIGCVCLAQDLVFLAWVVLFRVCSWFVVGLISFKWFGFIIELRLAMSLWYSGDLLLACELGGCWCLIVTMCVLVCSGWCRWFGIV